ncbi:MAG: ABC transporter permease subunit, partial [Sulfuricaulis sp.]|uniref:ABC transporter permease subunit n=1 Tax=Sulfuricaulis sp. TaxID=2003553 RepID=UPI003C620D36
MHGIFRSPFDILRANGRLDQSFLNAQAVLSLRTAASPRKAPSPFVRDIATYLPYGIRPLASAFVQVHAHLEESSLVCGASPLTTMRRIIIPLLIPGIVSAWILMASMFVRELTLSVVLSRPGTEVLAVQILRFADDGLWGRLSALGIIMIFISTALVVMATLIGVKLR